MQRSIEKKPFSYRNSPTSTSLLTRCVLAALQAVSVTAAMNRTVHISREAIIVEALCRVSSVTEQSHKQHAKLSA